MFSVFLDLGKKIGIFILVGQTVIHFGIGRKYEAYMKLVISLMVVVQIAVTFGAYLQKDTYELWQVTEEEYYEKWETMMKDMEDSFKKEQKSMENQVAEKFREETKKGEKTKQDRIHIETIRID